MNESNTTLHPPWLNIWRGAWIVGTLITLALFVLGGLTNLQTQLFVSCTTSDAICGPWQVSVEDMALAQALGLPTGLMVSVYVLNALLPRIAFFAVGAVIFWRKSDDWVALLLSFMLVGFVLEGLKVEGVAAVAQGVLYGAITGIFFLLPFIFPNGRWIPHWTIWLGVPLAAVGVASTFLPLLGERVNSEIYTVGTLVPSVLWFIVGGYAAVYRYVRVSNAQERQQTKWIMAGLLGTTVLFIPFAIVSVYFPTNQPSPERLAFMFLIYLPFALVSYLSIPVSIGISILKYRLWDIDVLIRRTVTYGVVVALLAIVYFGAVILMQQIFAGIVGAQDELITVLSTLAIAALFVPLRNRVQDGIDRQFNRKKYDAQRVLTHFGETVRDETDIEKLTNELVSVVHDTMQPKSVSLWLRETENGRNRTGR